MRLAFPMLFLTACAATRPIPSPAAHDPPPVAVPEAVLIAKRHVVAVYYRATCATLDKAKSRGNGFYVNDKTVATVWHYVEHDKAPPLFPDFAVIGEDGCRDAQPADFDAQADIYYLRVRGHHGPGLTIADHAPKPGEKVYAVSNRARKFAPAASFTVNALTVRPREPEEAKLAEPPTYTVDPAGILGDSGSPVLDARGEVVGMVDAIVEPRSARPYGMHISGFMVKLLLGHCGPCEED